MATMDSVLASIPGYGAYIARRQMNEQAGMQDLQQAGQLMQIYSAAQAHQKNADALAREEGFRREIQALGPNATEEQRAAVAARYAGADTTLKTQQDALNRKATIDAAKETRAAALEQAKALAEQTHQLRLAQLQDQNLRTQETARHNRQMEQISAELAALRGKAVEQPKPPAGYRYTPDGNMEPVPGGPADLKIQGAFNQDTATLNTTTANMDRLATAANEVLNHPGLAGITGIRGAIPNVPGSAAANAQAKLDTLKAQVGFGVLQELRNSSKTGGALGQVTEKEHALLQNALAALQNAQSKEQMQESLRKVIEYTEGAKERLRSAYNMRHPDRSAEGAQNAPAQPGAPQAQQPGVLRQTSKSGKPIISRDGGKTWEYE